MALLRGRCLPRESGRGRLQMMGGLMSQRKLGRSCAGACAAAGGACAAAGRVAGVGALGLYLAGDMPNLK